MFILFHTTRTKIVKPKKKALLKNVNVVRFKLIGGTWLQYMKTKILIESRKRFDVGRDKDIQRREVIF